MEIAGVGGSPQPTPAAPAPTQPQASQPQPTQSQPTSPHPAPEKTPAPPSESGRGGATDVST